jgi:hypothetical protein
MLSSAVQRRRWIVDSLPIAHSQLAPHTLGGMALGRINSSHLDAAPEGAPGQANVLIVL